MQSVLNRLRVLANTRKLEVATMMDTAGPGTRTGELHQQMPLQLTIGEEVALLKFSFKTAKHFKALEASVGRSPSIQCIMDS